MPFWFLDTVTGAVTGAAGAGTAGLSASFGGCFLGVEAAASEKVPSSSSARVAAAAAASASTRRVCSVCSALSNAAKAATALA